MFFFFILLGLLPSLFWLGYYLKKDIHPEPKRMIIRVFFLGMAIAPVAAIAEMLWANATKTLICNPLPRLCGETNPFFFFQLIIGIAAIEEYAKYYVVRRRVLPTREFDEPVDAMVYLIVSALGFAALENIFILVAPNLSNIIQSFSQIFLESFGVLSPEPILSPTLNLGNAFSILGFRFFGATFLHALASATVGYFLALSFFRPRHHRIWLILAGLSLATVLHAFYNYFIITLDMESLAGVPQEAFFSRALIVFGPVITLIVLMTVLVSSLFRRLKIVKSGE